jgi:glucosamine kinase
MPENGLPENALQTLFLGVDGGGTKCQAVIMTAQGETLGRGVGGPANAYQNLVQTQQSILDASLQALHSAGLSAGFLSELIAGIGLAGVNVPSVFTAMNQWHHPFKKMHLATDLYIACVGAHQGDGAVIVAGTGSCGYSMVNSNTHMLGGHGFLLGDKGSAAWIGLEVVKAVLLALDHLGEQTLLSQFICSDAGANSMSLVEKMTNARTSDYAQLAKHVFIAADANDAVAKRILREGADYLSALAAQLWATHPKRMSFIGGMSAQILPWLSSDIAEKMSAPMSQPEYGAVWFAKQQEIEYGH